MLKSLVDKISGREDLPVEIDDIVFLVVEGGWQDELFFYPADSDPKKIRGAFRQFTHHVEVYGEPQLVTHIAYSRHVSMEWQRVICAKELIHIFDPLPAKTETEDEVALLLDRLVGPLSNDDFGFADMQASVDRLALYQALPLLFPAAALETARGAVADGVMTIEEVADRAALPVELVEIMLNEEWQRLNGLLYRECPIFCV